MDTNEKSTLGQWAAAQPGAISVFMKYDLDFYCEGSQPLEGACASKDLAPDKVMAEIKEHSVGKNPRGWSGMSLEEMIDVILVKFHEKHRSDLKNLIPLSKKVESVHADRKESPQGLGNFLEKMLFELESHMQKEEMVLFPMIKSGKGRMANGPISVMMNEHVGHGESLKEMKALAKNYQLPSDACGSWTALYQGVATLERELLEHLATENNLLFPMALNG